MANLDPLSLGSWDWTLLPLGAVLLFAASNAIVSSIGGDSASTRARAVGYWIPIAAAAVAAVWSGQWDRAISIVFSTSVGCLSLAVGSVLLSVSPKSSQDKPAGVPAATANPPAAKSGSAGLQRLWPFVVPTALLTLLAGFSGYLSVVDAMVLLVEGAALVAAWDEIIEKGGPMHPPANADAPPSRRLPRGILLVLAMATAVVGAIALNIGAGRLNARLETQETGLLVAVALTPILLAPLLVSAAGKAYRGLADSAITTAIAIALLNLCLLLPLCILLWYPASLHATTGAMPKWHDLTALGSPIFPLIAWRVDNVMLLLLGFMLVPAAMGRWVLGRAEGITLLGLYVAYVLMEAVAAIHT